MRNTVEDRPRAGLRRWLTGAALAVVSLAAQGCVMGPYDGMRVANTVTPISYFGYLTAASTSVKVQAWNPATATWTQVATTTSAATVGFTMNDGTQLYRWDAGSLVLPAAHWIAGTGGSYARLRVRQVSSTGSEFGLSVARRDWLGCFFENFNGEGNTLNYLVNNCFSHRGEAYVYTDGYTIAPPACPGPAAALAKKNGHYMLTSIPACAQQIIRDRMAEEVTRNLIDGHYNIEHNSAASASSTDTVLGNELGGFFGGHERYLRRMERHVMVYDYNWMPQGKIPSWDSATAIPAVWWNAVAAPGGAANNCGSTTPGCMGWLSNPIVNSTPNRPRPAGLAPGVVCAFPSPAELHGAGFPSPSTRTWSWHNGVHPAVGGSFATFDSPSFPLFFLWHNFVQDVWLDWKACGIPF